MADQVVINEKKVWTNGDNWTWYYDCPNGQSSSVVSCNESIFLHTSKGEGTKGGGGGGWHDQCQLTDDFFIRLANKVSSWRMLNRKYEKICSFASNGQLAKASGMQAAWANKHE